MSSLPSPEPVLIPEVVPAEPAPPSAPAPLEPVSAADSPPKKKRGRKPGTKVVRLKNGRIRAVAPAAQPPTQLPAVLSEKGSKIAKALREDFRDWMRVELGWLQNQIKTLAETATKEDHPRVLLVTKLLDKLVPEAKEATEHGEVRPIAIQINNVNRGRPS